MAGDRALVNRVWELAGAGELVSLLVRTQQQCELSQSLSCAAPGTMIKFCCYTLSQPGGNPLAV